MNTAIQINIKKQLAKKNISAAELERRTGIPHAVVNILHGRSKNPSLRTAQAIARELDLSVEELFSEQQEPTVAPGAWNGSLYKKATDAVCKEIATKNLEPDVSKVSECINEVYTYTKDSPSCSIDTRFVAWIVSKHLSA